MPFIRGPITPFRGQQRSPWLLTTYVRHGMILQVVSPPWWKVVYSEIFRDPYQEPMGQNGTLKIWMFPKIGGLKTPKMDGENNGQPYGQMDDLGVPLFLETPIWE